MRPRSILLPAVAAAAALALTGCGSDDAEAGSGPGITVNATDTACELSATTVLQAVAWALYVGTVMFFFLRPSKAPVAAPASAPAVQESTSA